MPKAVLAREWLAAAGIASSGMWETSIRPAAGSGVRTLPSSHRRPLDAPNALGHRLGLVDWDLLEKNRLTSGDAQWSRLDSDTVVQLPA